MSTCAWCGCDLGDGASGSHGICDTCMSTFFGVDAQSIHAEIAAETVESQVLDGDKQEKGKVQAA